MELPCDIKAAWLKVVRRLQSVAGRQRGYSIISINVVINPDGIPVMWDEPRLSKLEPQADVEKVLMQLIAGFRN